MIPDCDELLLVEISIVLDVYSRTREQLTPLSSLGNVFLSIAGRALVFRVRAAATAVARLAPPKPQNSSFSLRVTSYSRGVTQGSVDWKLDTSLVGCLAGENVSDDNVSR